MEHKQTIGVGVVALLIGVAIGVAGTHLFSPKTTTASAFTRGGGSFAGARGGTTATFSRGVNSGSMLAGTITSTGSGSVVLNTRDGNSHVVLITPDTTVSKSVDGTLSDVTKGSTVIVSGTTNSDGSVSANLIQIRPASNVSNQPLVPTP